ncbi:hypothetical protein HPB48_016526 [Haemaphysalis longicornis]|uniref:DDE Tnp4 domain-containing protein n=1 Tax=Haemaphysalis longicornis TaxID=44386 RepID=A0A9J6G3G3_HAELO|nr:hypothetical protein HPB48_016526 [Haemaphysalis longicornis]
MVLLALVDHRYRFRFVNVGSPGRGHDTHLYQRYPLVTAVEGPLFRAPLAVISGTEVPPLVLRGQSFPLTPNLVKPFSHRGQLGVEQKPYNDHLSRSRRIVENVFGRLKGRFRSVLNCIRNVHLAIHACCVLNSVCEYFGDAVLPQLCADVKASNVAYEQPAHSTDAVEGSGHKVRAAHVDFCKRRQ